MHPQIDRSVKIWHLPFVFGDRDANLADISFTKGQPVFSTRMLHSAPPVSVTWYSWLKLLIETLLSILWRRLDNETLMSQSRSYEDEQNPGSLVIWKWLSFNRFTPPDGDFGSARSRGTVVVWQFRLNDTGY
jgi:hypothetical protein